MLPSFPDIPYKFLEQIGEGSFGKVFKGCSKQDNSQLVAIKVISKGWRSEKDVSNLRSEFKIQRGLKQHPNIVQIIDYYETNDYIISVNEYVGGELHKLLSDARDPRVSKESVIRAIAIDLLNALHYLHSHRILHRDIKPQNVLIDDKGHAKLCDFGFARHLGKDTLCVTSIKGTPLYMAPELIKEEPYDESADIWSVGCLLYELTMGELPFSTKSIFNLVEQVRNNAIKKWPTDMSDHFVDFLKRLLQKEPEQRMSWAEMLKHPFLAEHYSRNPLPKAASMASGGSRDLAPLTEPLTDLQQLKKGIQRQEKIKTMSGGSQTLIRAARKQEEQKKRLREQQEQRASCFNKPIAVQSDQLLAAPLPRGQSVGSEGQPLASGTNANRSPPTATARNNMANYESGRPVCLSSGTIIPPNPLFSTRCALSGRAKSGLADYLWQHCPSAATHPMKTTVFVSPREPIGLMVSQASLGVARVLENNSFILTIDMQGHDFNQPALVETLRRVSPDLAELNVVHLASSNLIEEQLQGVLGAKTEGSIMRHLGACFAHFSAPFGYTSSATLSLVCQIIAKFMVEDPSSTRSALHTNQGVRKLGYAIVFVAFYRPECAQTLHFLMTILLRLSLDTVEGATFGQECIRWFEKLEEMLILKELLDRLTAGKDTLEIFLNLATCVFKNRQPDDRSFSKVFVLILERILDRLHSWPTEDVVDLWRKFYISLVVSAPELGYSIKYLQPLVQDGTKLLTQTDSNLIMNVHSIFQRLQV